MTGDGVIVQIGVSTWSPLGSNMGRVTGQRTPINNCTKLSVTGCHTDNDKKALDVATAKYSA